MITATSTSVVLGAIAGGAIVGLTCALGGAFLRWVLRGFRRETVVTRTVYERAPAPRDQPTDGDPHSDRCWSCGGAGGFSWPHPMPGDCVTCKGTGRVPKGRAHA